MIDFRESDTIADAYLECKAYTRRYAKSFYFASHVLPREKRMAAYAIYAFCRLADNVIDEPPIDGQRVSTIARLNDLRDELNSVYSQGRPANSTLLAFRETVVKYQIPQQYFLDLLRGVEMDLRKHRYSTFDELEEYCYCVASVVGLTMAKVFGYRDETALEYAKHLGTAMQLTNIIRDVEEDYRRGRIYIPEEDLARFGVTEEHLERNIVNDNIRQLMAFQVARARSYYEKAAPGIPMLTNDGSQFCVHLMSDVYSGILDDVKAHGYNVFGYRASVPMWKKAGIAFGIAISKVPNRKAQ